MEKNDLIYRKTKTHKPTDTHCEKKREKAFRRQKKNIVREFVSV